MLNTRTQQRLHSRISIIRRSIIHLDAPKFEVYTLHQNLREKNLTTLSKDFSNLNADQKAAFHLALQLFIVINLTPWVGHDSKEIQPQTRYTYVCNCNFLDSKMLWYVLQDFTHIFAIEIAFSQNDPPVQGKLAYCHYCQIDGGSWQRVLITSYARSCWQYFFLKLMELHASEKCSSAL